MNDPGVLTLISGLFAVLGAYNLYNGSRKIRDARIAGHPVLWYKQINFLTGIEYIVLTFVFLLSIANRQGTILPAFQAFVVPLYLILLAFAAALAGFVIRQGILNARVARASTRSRTANVSATTNAEQPPVKELMEPQTQRQRERRKHAAAARRRRAGKA